MGEIFGILVAVLLIKLHLIIPLAIIWLVAWLIWRTLSSEFGLIVALLGLGVVLAKCS
jgi:hypothetical protein